MELRGSIPSFIHITDGKTHGVNALDELSFKWTQQHVRIPVFLGTSENAVKTQIWIAISTYVLIAIAKKRLHLDHHNLYEIVLSIPTPHACGVGMLSSYIWTVLSFLCHSIDFFDKSQG